MTIHNPQIASLFNRYAVLLEIKGANPFRIRAYRNAARTIENLPRDIAAMLREGADLAELPGIGDDLAHKLAEIVKTEKFKELESLKHELPPALADMTEVPGIGPKRIRALYRALNIKSREDLYAAARSGRLRKVRGFGPKTLANILKAAEKPAVPARFKLSDAQKIGEFYLDYLKTVPGVIRAEIAGSYRRRKDTVGDLDILVTCRTGSNVTARFIAYSEVEDVLAQGSTKASVKLKSGMQVDMRVVPERSYGAALVYFTGSKAHNIAIRAMGLKRKLKFNEYGVFRGAEWIAGRSEADVYAKLDLPYIEPELRENQGEIEAAKEGRLPELVRVKDMKGDLHVHTEESDGEATLEEMAEAARAMGYEYVAITDHSKHIGITRRLDSRRLAGQMRRIDKLNGKLRGFQILKSAEVDILADGSLAPPDSILKELDLVVASVHSKFDLPAKAQTERIIRAMDNPYVSIIGHPFGRLLGERDPCQLDIRMLMEAAKKRGCHLEVNAQPTRLDLSDVHCRMAKALALTLAISTDAHSPGTLSYMHYGVEQARRGWLEAKDVINTRPLAQLRNLLKRH
jgi:DNA polymerase (family 10)